MRKTIYWKGDEELSHDSVCMQADFSFFFDTGGRRRCYIAPERFYESSSSNLEQISVQRLQPEMVCLLPPWLCPCSLWLCIFFCHSHLFLPCSAR